MRMVEKRVEECSAGQIVAEDVISGQGVIWIGRDTMLNSYLINRLKEMNVDRVKVYAGNNGTEDGIPCLQDLHRSSVTMLRTVIGGLVAGQSVSYLQIERISDELYRALHDHEGIAKCLLQLREADEYTFSHCINTAFYCMLIGNWLGLPESGIKKAVQAGVLHDVGKALIPDEVLNKKGRLTAEEFEIIKKHPEIGFELVKNITGLESDILDGVLHHHERMDRSGYPGKVSGEAIGLYARIVAVADVFDAMTSDRVYKKGATPFEAFRMFQTIGPGMFDPEIVFPFIKRLSAHYVGCRVLLDDRTEGEIVYVPPQDVSSPIIRVGELVMDLSARPDLKILSVRT